MRPILLSFVLTLAACATAPVRTPKVPDLPEADLDPIAFLGIAIPSGVPVKASVITSKPAGLSWQVLGCEEHENVVGFVPPRDEDYVNLYLVQQIPAADPSGASRYLVAELWRYRPAAGVKICHRWVIWQDDPRIPPARADYAVIIEDFENRVLEQRTAEVPASALERLIEFHAKAVEFFREHPPEHPDDGSPMARTFSLRFMTADLCGPRVRRPFGGRACRPPRHCGTPLAGTY